MSVTQLPRSLAVAPPTVVPPAVSKAGHHPVHPLGGRAKVLLCSVFGPYARDDEYGSRAVNPMELWHNQVTRVQGAFSLRMFHRSWGLMLIQANLQARCTCLDFPDLERFIAEIRDNDYDVVGISAILTNLAKVKKMCQLIRQHLPKAKIVIGGHISGFAELDQWIDADHIVRGEGVRWFRTYLGEDPEAPIRHPAVWAGINRRSLGVNIPFSPRNSAVALIPSVGCPIGCNFCSTSAMFGGKGRNVNFYHSAEELFAVMCQLEESMKAWSFFVMDENFLLQKQRSLGLLELMQKHDKAWALNVFSSANALRMYSMEELVGLGLSWVWLGLEGKNSQYGKLKSTDTHELVANLRANGVRVLGSSIIGLEEHTVDNIDAAIAHAVSHDTDFHQFMLYTPVAGTPLYAQHQAEGTLLGPDEIAFEDTHGQYRFNYRHPHIPKGAETELLLRAFNEDFRVNGPSVLRQVRTSLNGWQRHRKHPDARIRRRFALEIEGVSTIMAGAVWAAKRFFADNAPLAARLDELLKDLYREFPLTARLSGPLLGRFFRHKLARETADLAAGKTFEPPTFYERNYVDTDAPVKAGMVQSVGGLPAKTSVAR